MKIRYPGFTLIEMLVIMSIIIIITAISIGMFTDLRTSVILNETSTNLQQTIRSTQRDAMLLKRNSNERWIYGIGIDFSTLETDGQYRIFKWCSPFPDYGIDYSTLSGTLSTSKFPNYDTTTALGPTNGNFPATSKSTWSSDCSGLPVIVSSIGNLATMNSEVPTKISQPVRFFIPTVNNQQITYIVFESISGRAFFYNSNGQLLNYDSDGTLSPTSQNFLIFLADPEKNKEYKITVKNISGKLNYGKVDEDEEIVRNYINAGE